MMNARFLLNILMVTLTMGAVGYTTPIQAQEDDRDWPLEPLAPNNRPVTPFFEGWYENEDGSVTLSFGYFNRNQDRVVEIPIGDRNYLEPEAYDGLQPEIFFPGRQHGVFAVTVPADATLPARVAEDNVWWHITNEDGEVHEVPGRAISGAYQLDRAPRPHGSVPPLVWFEDEEAAGSGPEGVIAEETHVASVGTPITLEANVRDPSERDAEDRRFLESIPVRVVWFKHQGPGDVTLTRHESMPEPDESEGGAVTLPQMRPPPPSAVAISFPGGDGTARVSATFSEPGEYMLRARADNWSAADSHAMDQCCWTNGYVRVNVLP